MSNIQLVSLLDVERQKLIDLMNNVQVKAQLPLLTDVFTQASCTAFLEAKQKMWEEHGYGPWAFIINGEFAGWGGLQPESGEADFALVLHPDFWGYGLKIFKLFERVAFDEMNLSSITALFPPSRKNWRALIRFGFIKEQELVFNERTFIRFRLRNNR
ncbi:GNAT family N-acetyltransferase [Photobacterium sp. BZF1]|uniref:GNAT family N-acetyltransferase n=1 Tax=Photobacterium sp. BZF1 TaxID=1904457 RepID=UPI00165397CE|nr:GNAT family protein [Photobacterium sp. BZF1]MBC7006535.1 GNAT family N-acetyltransferase [Photobacterium sp. BZF1]